MTGASACRSMRRTACTARLAILKTRRKTLCGYRQRVAVGRTIRICECSDLRLKKIAPVLYVQNRRYFIWRYAQRYEALLSPRRHSAHDAATRDRSARARAELQRSASPGCQRTDHGGRRFRPSLNDRLYRWIHEACECSTSV